MPRPVRVVAALAVLFWSHFAFAQELPPAADKPRPRLELARALKNLQQATVLLQQAKDLAQAALQDADAANAHGKELEIEAVVRFAAEARQEAEALALLVDQRAERLRDLCARAAEEAPASLLPENDTLRARILAAAALPEFKAAGSALAKIEKEMTGAEAGASPATDPRLALVRYKLADLWRKEASAILRSPRPETRRAEQKLVQAIAKYREVLAAVDGADLEEGSSLHAAALRRVVQINASLYAGYRELGNARQKADPFAVDGHEAFELLKRAYPQEALPNGTTFVEVARSDAEAMTR